MQIPELELKSNTLGHSNFSTGNMKKYCKSHPHDGETMALFPHFLPF